MPKLPFFQLYPADWIQDTRVLSLSARGAWIDLLCAMWVAPERGKLVWTMSQFDQFLASEVECNCTANLYSELRDSGVGVFEEDMQSRSVTIMSRRMMREEKERNQARERQSRKRHAKNSDESRRIFHISEVRSHISEKKEPPISPLPDWLPAVAWGDYLEHRKKKRIATTEKAKQLAIKELGKLRESGNDPTAVINQSILNGWTGLFELRSNGRIQRQQSQPARMGPMPTPQVKPEEPAVPREVAKELIHDLVDSLGKKFKP